jgi:citrate synthase
MLRGSGHGPDRMQRLDELLAIQRNRGLPHPNIGFAIAALAYMGLMVRGAGEVIFNLARCAGWAAHALEEYDNPRDLPRLQSVYVGLPPGPAR